MKNNIRCFALIFLLFLFYNSFAVVYPLPKEGDSIIGKPIPVRLGFGATRTFLGEKYGVSYFDIEEANPKADPDDLFVGETLLLPTEFILPPGPRMGIVINLSELRLYYYPKHTNTVMTFPIGIGRLHKSTPLMQGYIIEKRIDPVWMPTSDTRAEAEEKGIILPKEILAGPDNPLGYFALRLSLPSYLIHGTNFPPGVGVRSSAGCIRMYNKDVKQLYDLVSLKTPVRIINEPYKLGFRDHQLFLEIHRPLTQGDRHLTLPQRVQAINQLLNPLLEKHAIEIDWDVFYKVVHKQNGIPTAIGHFY